MRHILPLAALALATVGCAKNIPIAEGECSDLLKETFRDASFETEEEEEALQSLLLGMHTECMGNLADDVKDRALNPGPLTAEYLDGLPQPEGTTPEEQTPVGLNSRSAFPLSKHLEGMQDTNQNCMGSDSTKYSTKVWTDGEECFFDGTCSTATSTGLSLTKNILATVWIESFADYYRTTIPFEDGEVEAIVSRGWIAETFKSGQDGDGGSEWRQRYVLDVYYVDPADDSKTLRYYMFWSEASLPGVGDDLYVAQVRDGLEENFANVDAFFGGEICDDRDMTEDEAKEL